MAIPLATGQPPDPLAVLGTWLVMTVAMMVPLTVASIRTTAARSLWSRRERAVAGFLLGYLGPWLIAGMAVTMLATVLAGHSLTALLYAAGAWM
jgi:predicted metal-binding membrane protein